jgi:hypothetical protein
MTGEMGLSSHFAQQQFSKAHVRGSKADIVALPFNVRFTPESGPHFGAGSGAQASGDPLHPDDAKSGVEIYVDV